MGGHYRERDVTGIGHEDVGSVIHVGEERGGGKLFEHKFHSPIKSGKFTDQLSNY
jgi:hypothetical protein